MLKLAVIGKDVSRSQSPGLHSFLLGKFGELSSYEKISVPVDAFDGEAEKLFERLDGFNVTAPYKERIIPHLKQLGRGAEVGAVNTVLCAGRLGWNTDGEGFAMALASEGIEPKNMRALVLGAGGAGKSVISALAAKGADVYAYSRTFSRVEAFYAEFRRFTPLKEIPMETFDLIVNCTGVGAGETRGKSPVGKEVLARSGVATELVYEPAETEFLRLARECGKKTFNGAGMLFFQGYLADCLFLGREASKEEAFRLYREYREGKK